jgi:hypothetical protein
LPCFEIGTVHLKYEGFQNQNMNIELVKLYTRIVLCSPAWQRFRFEAKNLYSNTEAMKRSILDDFGQLLLNLFLKLKLNFHRHESIFKTQRPFEAELSQTANSN